MFLLDTLLLLSPLAIYTYIRVRQQIATKRSKRILTAAFVLAAFGYPLAESLSHSAAGAWAKAVMIAGYCTLPFLLYLVLIVIVSDLIIGALRVTGLVSAESTGAPRFRRRRLALWLVIPVVVVTFGLVNHQRLRTTEYAIDVPRKSSQIRRLKIVFIADIHLNAITADDLLERLVDRVNAARPDVVLIGGDVLEGDRPDEDTRGYEAQFRRIRAKYGVFAAPGNHDRRSSRGGFFERARIRLLEDEVERVDNAFYVAGRVDRRSEARKSAQELLRRTPADLPIILIDHRPSDFESVSRSAVDVQLSGHTHHGQVFPANFVTQYQNPLSWGHLKKGHAHLFVTSGVQLWGPPVRTSGVAEVMVINVTLRDGA
jgi:predicted MPP superfamily phosphohydrolase